MSHASASSGTRRRRDAQDRRGRARQGVPPLVAHWILVDQPDPLFGEDSLGESLEPAPWELLVGAFTEQHPQRWRAGSTSTLPTLRDPAELVGRDPEAKRAVERTGGSADPLRRREERQRGGDREGGNCVARDDVVGHGASRDVNDHPDSRLDQGAVSPDDVDRLVAVESVEAVQSRRRPVGDRNGAWRKRRRHRSALIRQRHPRGAQHLRVRHRQHALIEEALLDPPVETGATGLRRGDDAVLACHE
ncbi:MAG: hypothetical protein WKF58_11330 [Ilumatobacteraceae bacterium]